MCLLVAVATIFESWPGSNAFFGFESGTEYTLGTGIGYAFSKKPIHLGDTFDLRCSWGKCLRLGGLAV